MKFLSKLGFMLLPESILALDKQKHGCLAIVVTMIVFFFTTGMTKLQHWITAIITFIVVSILAWGIEYYQRKTGSGQFDIWDALIMQACSVILLAIILLFINPR